MKQPTLATSGFEKYSKTTKRAVFLAQMNQVVPWPMLCSLIEPVYPKAGNGRRPRELEQMLRIYFLQQWFNLSGTRGGRVAVRLDLDASVHRHRPGAGGGAGRDHHLQVPTSAGAQ